MNWCWLCIWMRSQVHGCRWKCPKQEGGECQCDKPTWRDIERMLWKDLERAFKKGRRK